MLSGHAGGGSKQGYTCNSCKNYMKCMVELTFCNYFVGPWPPFQCQPTYSHSEASNFPIKTLLLYKQQPTIAFVLYFRFCCCRLFVKMAPMCTSHSTSPTWPALPKRMFPMRSLQTRPWNCSLTTLATPSFHSKFRYLKKCLCHQFCDKLGVATVIPRAPTRPWQRTKLIARTISRTGWAWLIM